MVNLENKVQEESVKKTWISPEMEEIHVDGAGTGVYENASLKAS